MTWDKCAGTLLRCCPKATCPLLPLSSTSRIWLWASRQPPGLQPNFLLLGKLAWPAAYENRSLRSYCIRAGRCSEVSKSPSLKCRNLREALPGHPRQTVLFIALRTGELSACPFTCALSLPLRVMTGTCIALTIH